MISSFTTCRPHRPALLLLGWLCTLLCVIGIYAFSPSTAFAQDTPIADEVGNSDPTTISQESEAQDISEETARTTREILLQDFQIPEELVDDPADLEMIASAAAQLGTEANNVNIAATDRLDEARRLIALLERQLENDDLPALARRIIVSDLAIQRIAEARRTGHMQASQIIKTRQQELSELAREHGESLLFEQEQATEDQEAQNSQSRLEQAEEAHQDALRRVADATQREQAERDQQLRALRTQERELAEELAALALREGDQVRQIEAQRRELAEIFSDARTDINAQLVDFSDTPDAQTQRDSIDPLFERVVRRRREARRELYAHRDLRRTAEEDLKILTAAHEDALQHDNQLRSIDDDSEQLRRRIAISQLQLQLAERELTMGREVLDSHHRQQSLHRERVLFYHDTVESLVPLISRSQRAQFYSLRHDENWRDAVDGFRHAADQIRLTLENRSSSLSSFPDRAFSMATVIWLFGLMWRLMLFSLAIYIGRRFSTKIARRTTDSLLSRRFFRSYASLTIKATDFLGSMLQPALLYLAAVIVLAYAADAWPEFHYFRWTINAVFIYWTVMTAVQVLTIPRQLRQGVQPVDQYLFEDKNRERAHTKLETPRFHHEQATKIVTSTRVVLIFGLLAYYLPALVLNAVGHTVVWRIVDRLAIWGLLAVVYVVLSTWRDDIATMFSRMASDRMPRSVAIVQEQKTRPWGVLLIALASIYVIGRELARVGKAYFERTEWNRRLANFFFRKKIELQTRVREEAGSEVPNEVPAHYRDWFHNTPLTDEPYAIQRTLLLERIEKNYLDWRANPRNGAVAVVGEQGIGKTTLFNQLQLLWSDHNERPVSSLQLTDKLHNFSDVIHFLASFFTLESVPENLDDLVQMLLDLPPRILFIDDCHHLFLRRIGGFEAIDTFLTTVGRTDQHHFWVLSFQSYTWSYLNRIQHRKHFFTDVIELEPWKKSEIQELIQRRDHMDDLPISFTELIVAHHEDEDQRYEIVRTSNGYFRLLHEFSQGNPSVALTFWIRSLRLDKSDTLQVELFRRPILTTLRALNDDYLFALATIALHGSLRSDEIASILNLYHGDSQMIVDYLADSDILEVDPIFRRSNIRPLFLRAVLKTLQDANVLYV